MSDDGCRYSCLSLARPTSCPHRRCEYMRRDPLCPDCGGRNTWWAYPAGEDGTGPVEKRYCEDCSRAEETRVHTLKETE